jgi:hypothetical protein
METPAGVSICQAVHKEFKNFVNHEETMLDKGSLRVGKIQKEMSQEFI